MLLIIAFLCVHVKAAHRAQLFKAVALVAQEQIRMERKEPCRWHVGHDDNRANSLLVSDRPIYAIVEDVGSR